MIHGQPKTDLAAAIMSDDSELIMVQLRHQSSKIIGNHPLRLLAMIILDGRLARPAVTTHVRTDNSETGARQTRSNPMPGRRGPGMTMDEKQGRTVAAEPYAELRPHRDRPSRR